MAHSSNITVIMVTSAARSNPTTILFERVWNSYVSLVPNFLNWPKFVICDHPKKVIETEEDLKLRTKRGEMCSMYASRYSKYLENLEALIKNESNGRFKNTNIVKNEKWRGFGGSLWDSLAERVKTEYVLVLQHDRCIERYVNMEMALRVMDESLKQSKTINGFNDDSSAENNHTQRVIIRSN